VEQSHLPDPRDLDVSLLLEVSAPPSTPQLLSLEDLSNIDWELAASSVLGVLDPIGQLREWLASLLAGLLDSLRKAVEAIVNAVVSPVASAVSTALSMLGSISGTLTSILDSLRSVVVKPILDALAWVSSAFPSVVSAVSEVLSRIASALAGIPDAVRGVVDRIAAALGELAAKVRADIAYVLELLSKVPGFISDLLSKVATAFSDLASRVQAGFAWFVDQVTRLPGIVSDLVNRVATAFSELIAKVREDFTWLLGQIAKIPELVGRVVSELGSRVTAVFTSLAESVRRGFEWILEQISRLPGIMSDLLSRVSAIFGELASRIQAGLAWLVDQLAKVPGFIADLLSRVAAFFGELAARIQAGFAWFIEQVSKVPGFIADLFSRVASVFGELAARVQAGFAWFIEQVTKIPGFIADLLSKVAAFFGELAARIQAGFSWFVEQIAKIPGFIADLLARIASAFSELASRVQAGFSWFVEQVARLPGLVADLVGNVTAGIGGVVEWLRRGFDSLSATMSRWFEGAREWFGEATKVLSGLGAAFMGFVNALLQLPERLREMFAGVVRFFEGVWQGIQEFVKDPLGWLKKNVVEPIWSGLLWVGGKVLEGLRWLWERIQEGLSWIWNALVSAVNFVRDLVAKALAWLGEAFAGWAAGVIDALKGIGEAVRGWFARTLETMKDGITAATTKLASDVLKPAWSELGVGTAPGLTLENFAKAYAESLAWLMAFFVGAVFLQLPYRAMAFLGRSIALSMRDVDLKLRISLKPLGVGSDVEFDVLKAVGAGIYNLSEELMKYADAFYQYYWLGIGFWYGRFASILLATRLRNFIPIEFPTVAEVGDAFLRSRVAEVVPSALGRQPKDVAETMVYFMKMRGYSDYLIEWMFAEPEDFYMTVEDRFGVRRKLPLASVWRMPSHSDLITMMIRDVIIKPKEFEKAAAAIGYAKDVASMYYLLHFRYPSPEKLAGFYWRGATGVLWYSLTLEEGEIASFLGVTWRAVPPKELNFRFDVLNDMMARYMKWHDLAPFAWAERYPTDKSIVVELMADLPDKVDFRWMARWGIMEHLSKLGVGMKTPVEEIVGRMAAASGRETVSERVTPEVSLDVSLLARFLESRGVHPYFAAIAAVAEMHVALTDEMTLLRSGFLELFRTGLVDLDASEKLMSGLFTIRFTTGFIDPGTGTSVTFNYVKPLYWLPAERRILQLRAAMDRAYEIWRSMLREVSYGVMRLALRVEEAEDLIRRYSNTVVGLLNKHVRAITGVDWRPVVDEDYVDLWVEYGSLLRTVEVRTWVRHYITRILAWIIYRSSYGWVKEEDFRQLIDRTVEAGWLTKEEGDFFRLVFPIIVRMVRRETIPTALTLATMAEYMVVDDETIDRVFEDQRVVEEYRDLYRRYIAVKPFKSDYKTLLNRARRALVLGAIAREEWERYKGEALAKYGFRETEIEIQEALADLEERIASSREYAPTPPTLATLSEYLVVPRELVEEALRARGVPEAWRSLWSRYISVRPLKPDYRAVLNTALRALRYDAITKELWESLLRNAEAYGFTPAEVSLLQLRAELELLVDEARMWRPSLLTLISMVEYVPEAVELLKHYRVDPAFGSVVERYARVKPLADEVRLLVNSLYRAKMYAAVPRELEDRVLSIARQLGVTDAELSLRELALELQVLVDESRAWTPTPATLATLSEYVVLPAELVRKSLEARRVPPEWIGIWLQYIAVRPLKPDYRAVLNTALRALRYGAIAADEWKRLLDAATRYGFTPEETGLLQLRAELELALEEAREYVPTPSALASMAEYLPEVRDYVKTVLEVRRVRGVWAELWTKYIYLRPIYDEVRRWVGEMFELAEYAIVSVDQLKPVFDVLRTYGWEELEVRIAERTVLAVATRRAWAELLGSARQLAAMSRYSEPAADLAWSRVARLVDLLPVDGATKELIKGMWRTYIVHYQNYPEIRSYASELVSAYAAGVLDDAGLERELGYLRKLGVPEVTLSLIRRRAQLRRVRYALRS